MSLVFIYSATRGSNGKINKKITAVRNCPNFLPIYNVVTFIKTKNKQKCWKNYLLFQTSRFLEVIKKIVYFSAIVYPSDFRSPMNFITSALISFFNLFRKLKLKPTVPVLLLPKSGFDKGEKENFKEGQVALLPWQKDTLTGNPEIFPFMFSDVKKICFCHLSVVLYIHFQKEE